MIKLIKEQEIESLVKGYKVNPLFFHVEEIAVSSEEEKIPSNYFPQGFSVRPGEHYPKNVYTFSLPFDGEETLLRCVPSTRILWTEEIAVENNNVVFQIIDFRGSLEEIKKERDRLTKFLTDQAVNVNRDIELHNKKIEIFVRNEIKIKEEKQAHTEKALHELGKPIKFSEKTVSQPKRLSQPTKKEEKMYDAFICHATEDKEYVDLLAKRLKDEGFEVWYDTFEVNWGDDLRPTIDEGLKSSKFGIVILSKAF